MPGITLPTPLEARWLRQLPDYLRDLAISPTVDLVAAADAAGTLTLLSLNDGATAQQIQLSELPVTALQWPRPQRLIAATEDGTLHLLDPTDGLRRVARIETPGPWIEGLDTSKGSLAFCAGRRAWRYSLDGEKIWESPLHESTLSGVAFLPDTSALATSCYGAMRIWSTEKSRDLLQELSWKGSLFQPHPSPDGTILACGCQDASVHFWRLTSNQDSEMSGYPSKPRCLSWAADSSLLATSASQAILVWSFEDGPEGTSPYTLGLNARPISTLTFHPEINLLLSGAEDGILFVWDPLTEQSPRAMASMFGEVSCVSWIPSTQCFVAGDSAGYLGAFGSSYDFG